MLETLSLRPVIGRCLETRPRKYAYEMPLVACVDSPMIRFVFRVHMYHFECIRLRVICCERLVMRNKILTFDVFIAEFNYGMFEIVQHYVFNVNFQSFPLQSCLTRMQKLQSRILLSHAILVNAVNARNG